MSLFRICCCAGAMCFKSRALSHPKLRPMVRVKRSDPGTEPCGRAVISHFSSACLLAWAAGRQPLLFSSFILFSFLPAGQRAAA
ncbi:hypothetical protein BT67DRAFT_444376 [Trichocladium antarcticum]|uniref:Uncharacterized protein n=1 Tax=Trichocladium antarcticum TaxID=1450529 RepID=A0AAN6ZC38_9PEZI|nr:hypothetical protein BT67DRAFT_444376 [Trichocladium antarcticum]